MERFASFDGVQIAYTVVGSGPDVLLIHGFASDQHGNWVAPGVRDSIAATGRRVKRDDARGHGRTDNPHDVAAYENNAMVRDAQALLDLLDVTAVDVVGYSMGSIVSTRLVPAEVRSRSLVLGGVGARRPRSREARDRIAAALESPGGAVAGEGAAERAFREFATRGGNDMAALAAVQRATNPRGDLGAIHVPTLVVAGEEDNLAGTPGELAAMISGATAQVIPGNHLSAVVKPEFANAITGFLGRVSPV